MTDEQRKEIEGIVDSTCAIMHPLANKPDQVYFQDLNGNLYVYAGRRDHGMIAGVATTADCQPTNEQLFEPKEVAFLNI